MADTSRVRDPLEIAATSPDPVVRRLAIKRKEMDRERAALDAFFSTYAEAPADAHPATPASAPAAHARRDPSAPVARRTPKGDAFYETVRTILVENGPLRLDDLWGRYCAIVPDTAPPGRGRERLRIGIAKISGRIGRVSEDDKRYWPADLPAPSAT